MKHFNSLFSINQLQNQFSSIIVNNDVHIKGGDDTTPATPTVNIIDPTEESKLPATIPG